MTSLVGNDLRKQSHETLALKKAHKRLEETENAALMAVKETSQRLEDVKSLLSEAGENPDVDILHLLSLNNEFEAAESQHNRALQAFETALETRSKSQMKIDEIPHTEALELARAAKSLKSIVQKRLRNAHQLTQPLSECQILQSKTDEQEIIKHFEGDLNRQTIVKINMNGTQIQVPKEEPYHFLRSLNLTHEQAMAICKYAHQGIYNDSMDLWIGPNKNKGVLFRDKPSTSREIEIEIGQTGNISIQTDWHLTVHNSKTFGVDTRDITLPEIILRCKVSTQSQTLDIEDVTRNVGSSTIAIPERESSHNQPPSPSDTGTESTDSIEVKMQIAELRGTDGASPSRSPSPEDTVSTGSTEPVTARSPSPEETGAGSTEPVNT